MIMRTRVLLAGAALVAVAGLGTGIGFAASGSSGQPGPATASAASSGPGYSWYRSMMSGYLGGGSMMGGSSSGWMMSGAGYQWMAGGASAPGWMSGGTLPGSMMMGASTDPGKIMGSLWANAPGQRVGARQAAVLGSQIPAGARVDKAANTVTFAASTVRLTMLASPSGGPDETFRAAGLTSPQIIVPAGARVSIQVINADSDTAHGLVITSGDAANSPMPMMTSRPAFTGSALWFLGNPTSAGMHAGTLTFTASTPGSYRYLCPVPNHAQEGMTGIFTVR